ncbi:hypothetical protein FBUS_10035 [Fasciolopsis buskii]|uniref:E3 ubiquitin-protein ligase n=1 Tax=Fasciolopsis buskii TaxID=27845 RepID=A0A8E0VPK0_9TREM|nr:hypothetical protein FBUS_10035 [Fasciolopsis buski]
MQRSEIPQDGSVPLQGAAVPVTVPVTLLTDEYRWFYEGFAGWWQYDDRTSDELESAFVKQLPSYEVQVAGYIYTVDFVHMTQKRKDNSGRKRRIKRDLKDSEKKGIAGIKLSAIGNKPLQSNGEASNAEIDPGSLFLSSANSLPIEDFFRSSCHLSTSSNGSRPGLASLDVFAVPPDQTETSPSPVERSRPTTRDSRYPSLTQSFSSLIPDLPSNQRVNPTRDGNRLHNSRISRSVPRD